MTWIDLEETRGLRTIHIESNGKVRYGTQTWFDPAGREDAEETCAVGLKNLRRTGLAEGFLELDVMQDDDRSLQPVIFQVLHLHFAAETGSESLAPLLRACSRPDIAFSSLEVHGLPESALPWRRSP
ncbi:MAG: hypothetical protein ABIP94_21125 [Planctomycetota bacterium]